MSENTLQVPADTAQAIRRELREVTARSQELPPDERGLAVPALPQEIPVPRVAWFVLTNVMGLPDVGRSEKTAWEIDFAYREVPVTLAHRKFGVRLEVWGVREPEAAEKTGRDFFSKLKRAVAILDRDILLPTATAQLGAGNVTLGNRHHQLRGHYDYFREAVTECLEGRGRWVADGRARNRLAAHEQEAFINFTAGLQAYFSWLEHTLVLVLPFSGANLSALDLRQVIRGGWRDKYRTVFDVAADHQANLHLSRLVQLSERGRNTWTHGGFDKEAGLLYVHLPGIGATPMGVNAFSSNVHFTGLMGIDVDFDGAWRTLDAVDEFLAMSETTRYGLRHAEAGLQVKFDASSRAKYEAVMTSDHDFETFLGDQADWEDRLHNMDW